MTTTTDLPTLTAPRTNTATAFEPSKDWESATAEDIVARTLERWGRRVALGTAFQDEGMALLDMAVRIGRDLGHEVRVFTLDTGRLPEESHQFVDAVRRRYDIEVEVHLPRPEDVAPLVRRHGANLFRDSVDLRIACCRARKVRPMGRALSDLDAWITGLPARPVAEPRRRAHTSSGQRGGSRAPRCARLPAPSSCRRPSDACLERTGHGERSRQGSEHLALRRHTPPRLGTA